MAMRIFSLGTHRTSLPSGPGIAGSGLGPELDLQWHGSTDRGFRRRSGVAVMVAIMAFALSACSETTQEIAVASIPTDYRQRHPIVIQEGSHSTDIFVGAGRGGLSSTQRADVIGFAQSWAREGTGAIVIDVPVDTPNARAARSSLRDIEAILGTSGIPSRQIRVRNYRPEDPRFFATIRMNYPRVVAEAGPCGLWPEDLGPSVKNPSYFENRPYQNFGCATQRNLAAMIDNPADLVQPRTESPAYTPRRNVAFDRYVKGNSTTTTYPEAEKAKLSDLGK
jgi:pilus assembly protein CpaD